MYDEFKKDKPSRRCRCHKRLIYVEYDGEGYETKNMTRHCIVTKQELSESQTYKATMNSDVELDEKPQDEVQKGIKLYE